MTRYLEVKPGSLSEVAIRLRDDYQAFFKKELEKSGKGIAQMSDAEKKAFFNRVDKAYNAKNEIAQPVTTKKKEDEKTTLVAKPKVKPDDKEEVRRIPVDKLADYKAKGWIEAESFVPEQAKNPYAIGMAAAMKATGDTPPLKKSTIVKAHDIAKKVKEEELTAGQKKLPPALQKAIEKKQKNEEVEITEITDEEEKRIAREITSLSNDKVMARINKKGDEAIAAIQAKIDNLKAERDKKRAQKNEEVSLEEKPSRKQSVMFKKADGSTVHKYVYGYNDDEIENQIKDIMNKEKLQVLKKQEPESIKEETLEEGQYKEIDTRKGDLRLAKDKRQALKDKYNAIMANQASGDEHAVADQIQKLDMSIKKQEQELIDIMKKSKEKKEEVEAIEEAAGPDRLTNLNDKITRLQVNLQKLDRSKPESKTKEAILKSDLTTAKLRLQDLMQKRNTETKKEVKNEKMNYKSMKKSMKKEQETPKKTMTDKPLTKVDVEPKISTH